MPVKCNIANKDGTYFITFTCSNWLPLFEQANAYDSVYNWFNCLHSSAKFYLTGLQGVFIVKHYKSLADE